MKLPFFTLSLLFLTAPLSSQNSAAQAGDTEKMPFLIIQTGLGLEWFENSLKFSSFTVERPVKPHVHVGLQGQYFYPKSTDYYGYSEFLRGFDVAFYTKYFFHGRFTGRKSGLYVGPDIRYGVEKYRYYNDIFFPPIPNQQYTYHDRKSLKILLRWGVQKTLGRAILEITCPLGMQFIMNGQELGFVSGDNQFVMAPMFQLGYAF